MIERNEAQRLAKDRHRCRWIIRVAFITLFFAITMTVIAYVMSGSSTMRPDEAQAILGTFNENPSRAEVEHSFGKADREVKQQDMATLSWRFVSYSLNEMDILECKMSCHPDGRVDNKSAVRCQFKGWSAWMVRWWMVKERLGWQ